MTETFSVACVQNRATKDIGETLERAEELSRRAAADGADLICLAEFFGCLHVDGDGLFTAPEAEAEHPALARFRAVAAELKVWMVMGSVAISGEDADGRLRNRSFLLDADGGIVARYDKIHLFDVDLADGESYRESAQFAPGTEAVVAATPWGRIGMTICYDLRFPHLYRDLAKAGASFLTVPAAFTKKTGEAHWHVLLRARAIETGSYVFAIGQSGRHGDAETFGHSLIVDPWGRIVAAAEADEAVISAEIDPAKVIEARAMIPALRHDRLYRAP